MSSRINLYALDINPKHRRDLLGIYQHYLYFEKGLELILDKNTTNYLSYLFIKRVEWDIQDGQSLPWTLESTTQSEREEYINFVNGKIWEPNKNVYMSLYHTQNENDVLYPKVNLFSNAFDFITIDLDLPCPVERYAAACPKQQKLKDAAIIIDGKYKVKYCGDKHADMEITEAMYNHQVQQGFRVLLSLADYYDRNKYEIENNHTNVRTYMMSVLKKIMTAELLSEFENKILDLLGSYSDKTQEIMRKFFPGKSIEDMWHKAEKEKLIDSADMMLHYLNLRHLMRHQWDTLDGTGMFGFGEKADTLRKEYMQSYSMIFNKTMAERIKTYQKAARHMQTLLKVVCPQFIARDKEESNTKFVQRLKNWQQQNPKAKPLVSINYPLNSDKQVTLVRSIKKVVPQAQILDIMEENKLIDFNEVETGYFQRTWFLRVYNHLESEMLAYCFTHGLLLNRNEMWKYINKEILSPQERDQWSYYRQLRNNLSHNYLSDELREELAKAVKEDFGKDVDKLSETLRNNTPEFIRLDDGTYSAVHNDGSTIQIDLEKGQVISYCDKNGKNLLERKKSKSNIAASPVKVFCQNKEIIDCRLGNGVYINLKRKKLCLPDDTRIYLDAKDFNVFCFENGDKVFTDKNFVIKTYMKQGKKFDFERNETCFVAPSHRMSTDGKKRISESCIIQSDGQKAAIKFSHTNRGATLVFSDGTVLDTSNNNLILSHNGTVLTPKNRFAFLESYLPEPPVPPSKLKDINQGR